MKTEWCETQNVGVGFISYITLATDNSPKIPKLLRCKKCKKRFEPYLEETYDRDVIIYLPRHKRKVENGKFNKLKERNRMLDKSGKC